MRPLPAVRHPAPLLAVVFGLALVAASAGAQSFSAVPSAAIAGHVSFSTGAQWVDVDGDGDLDLYVVTGFGADNANVLYRNDGGDTFVRVLAVPPVQDAADNVCATWADADGDGDLDAFLAGLGSAGGRLYRGAPGGTFTLDAASPLSAATLKGTGCAWGDYDQDGHVDLAVAVLAGQLGMSGPNRLFHADGAGSWSEITGVAPANATGLHHQVTWSDFDGDGDLDLFFASGPIGSTGTDRMYRNQLAETGAATFVALSAGPLTSDARDSQALTWVDIDDDGDLDCYAINYTSVPNQLYRNDGGTFTKLTTGSIVTDMGAAHGVAWGDYDNDGDQDVFVARDLQQQDRYYRNDGGGTFTSLTTLAPVTAALSGYAAVAGDYDRDGDLDLFVPTARTEAASRLYRNDLANGNHWLEVKLVGGEANRAGIGAKVRVRTSPGGTPRWQMREISASTGYGGHGPLEAHFGLGAANTIDSLEVEWPGGQVDRHAAVAVDTFLVLTQQEEVGVPARSFGNRLDLRVAPSPFRSATRVSWTLERAERLRVRVHDVRGRLVTTLADGSFAAGTHTLAFEPGPQAAAGVYFVTVATATTEVTRRMVRLP
jgi:hypothetical protein